MSQQSQDVVVQDVSGLAVDVLETLVNRAYDRAKRWAGAGLLLQGGLFIAGVAAIFWPSMSLAYPWFAVPIALLGGWVAWMAANFKSMAESAKRQHEYVAGFGMKPSGPQLADLGQNLKNELAPDTAKLLKLGITYASEEATGPRRALENLCESAWFTKHLAGRCVYWIAGTFIVTVMIAIALLLLLAAKATGTDAGMAASKGVGATFAFLISVGTIRSWVGYTKLATKAEKIDGDAARLLATPTPSMFDVQRLLAEYQVSRASAPLIPTWIWRVHRDGMNKDYKLRQTK